MPSFESGLIIYIHIWGKCRLGVNDFQSSHGHGLVITLRWIRGMLSFGYQRHMWPKLKLILTFSNILVCCCCSCWPWLPEPPSLRSRPKEHSPSFRALPANKTSSLRVGADHLSCPKLLLIMRRGAWQQYRFGTGPHHQHNKYFPNKFPLVIYLLLKLDIIAGNCFLP